MQIQVQNAEGRNFFVRVVDKGDKYGQDDCLTHERDRPMVEFYDMTFANKGFGPRGQFVSRYFLDTFMDVTYRMSLEASVPAWTLDAYTVAYLQESLRECMS